MGPVKAGKYEYRPESLVGLREKLGLKQTKMAELIGVPPNTLSRWEIGATKPDAESLAAIYSVAVDHGISPNFFQRRRPMSKTHEGRSRLVVMWDFQNIGVPAYHVPALDSWIRAETKTLCGNPPNVLFKAFASPHQSAATDQHIELGWRVFEYDEDIDDEVSLQAKSDCGHDPTDTVFVLITNDGGYADLLEELGDLGVLTYVVTPQLGQNQELVRAAGKQRWLQLPSSIPTQLMQRVRTVFPF